MKRFWFIWLILSLILVACGGEGAGDDAANADATRLPSGLQYVVIEEGTGPQPQAGDIVAVHYTGKLDDGTVFDSSIERGTPIEFILGTGGVIAGWDEGIALMKQGGKGILIIPPELGYGASGAPPQIPPNATLTFEVELVEVRANIPPTPAPTPTPGPPPTEVDEADYVELDDGLRYAVLEAGEGDPPVEGQVATMHYKLWLDGGDLLDDSYPDDRPIVFEIGDDRLIAAWSAIAVVMQPGEIAQFIVPPELAFGENATGPVPANATLIFEVELIAVSDGPPDAPQEIDEADLTTTESGLQYYDFAIGEGAVAEAGQVVSVHYTGWLTDGTRFDSSISRGEPITFVLGSGGVIPGWDEGIAGMQVGGRRQLIIPPDLAYGEQDRGTIPPNSILIFEVELVEIAGETNE